MSARKTPGDRRALQAEAETELVEAEAEMETTTSRSPADRTPAAKKKASKGRSKTTSRTSTKSQSTTKAKATTKKPAAKKRGRPRINNTETERVTLRVDKDQLVIIDTLVKLKKYSNRSEALRAAIKMFTDEAVDHVDEMTAEQEKRLKLLKLAALQEAMDELSGA